ncbi:Ig-like domain-containing protein [Moraxella sp.]|uniref:Ig-like domain-containing protein n=1 Tax=Moraxella sp. TaxID=479 RepID=UPI002602F74F|nr:Ig-like domain-containing protein [Moraxella sp.]
MTLIVSNNFQAANGRDEITLTVIARDATNAPIANVPVSLMSESDTAFFEALSGTTEENGRFTTTVTNSIAEAVEVKATAGGVPAEPVTLTFIDSTVDPRVDKVNVIITNDSQPANGRDEITLTVIVRDDQNVPLSNVPVNLVSSSDFALFDKISGTTGENGRFSTFITSSVPETFEVTATAGGKKAEPVKVTFTTAPVGEMVLSASQTILQTGESSSITVTILRKIELEELLEKFHKFFNNVTISESLFQELLQMDILLPNTPFSVAASGNAVLHDVPERTDANAQATFTVSNNHKEKVDITVTSGSVTKTLKLYFGASLNLLPHSVNAIETTTLTALLKDGNYAPIADQEVTFNFIDDNNEVLTPNTATTDIDGTAIVTIRDLENNGGTAEVNVSSGALNAQATVNFLAAFGENRHLDAETTATVLNIKQSATITAYITDHNDLPIKEQQVTFSVKTTDGGESQAKISPKTGKSDEKGEVKAIITNATGENVIVTVQADSAKQEIPLYFGANISLSPTEAENLADGASPVTLTAVVSDKDGVGIVGIPVYFRVITGNSIFLDNFRSNTDELGQTTVSVTSNSVDHGVIEAQADALTPATSTLTFYASQLINSLMLSTDADSLSFNSKEIPIKAVVKDVQGNPVKNGTPVDFMTTLGIITESVLTDNDGIAEAKFSPNMQAGLATITATAGNVTDSITLEVQPGDAGTIEVSKIEPQVIGVIGSGVVQSATIEFLVKDSLGNIVADGTPVKFSIGKTTLGGGETITTQGDMGKTAAGTTNNGSVSVTLKSGTVAGNIDVIATINDTISTIARVTIVGSAPDADHFSLAAEYLNIAGGVTFGLFDEIVAYVGDRFGNIVPDGTSVSFITEGGMIGKSIGGGAFTTTTQFGQATAILQSAEPTVPFLGGVPAVETAGYGCSGNYLLVENPLPGELLCGNPGFTTIVAYTTGSESFVDDNGNGIYDQGEPFDDLSEPYIDGNDNGLFEAERELYVDINGNGQFDYGNNQYDGPGGAFKNTTIWTDIRILFSAQMRTESEGITVTPSSFSIPNAGVETFIVSGIGDIYGNGLVEGTKVQVTTNNGVLGGQTDFTFTRNELGLQYIEFTLSSNPPKEITEKDKDGNEHTRQEYPLQDSATITISITSPVKDTGAGGNGNTKLMVFGQINVVK